MSILVQTTQGSANVPPPAPTIPPTPYEITIPFSGANNPGNFLLVITGALQDAFANPPLISPMVVGSVNGAYTQLFQDYVGFLSGVAIGAYIVPSCAAGTDSVTFSFVSNTYNWFMGMMLVELNLGSTPSYQTSNSGSIFGGAGDSPTNVTITDSHSTSVTIQLFGSAGAPSPSGGIGTQSGYALLDFIVGSLDVLFGASVETTASAGPSNMDGAVAVTPGGYQNFIQLCGQSPTFGGPPFQFALVGPPSLGGIVIPQIFVVT